MALTELLKSVAQTEDAEAAHVLALQLNADIATRRLIYGKSDFDATSIIRFGKTMLSYQVQGLPKAASLDNEIHQRGAEAVAAAIVAETEE